MVKEFLCIFMVTNMMARLKWAWQMARDPTLIKVGQDMWANGNSIYSMARAKKSGMMDQHIMDNIKKDINVVKENLTGQMEALLKVNGLIIK